MNPERQLWVAACLSGSLLMWIATHFLSMKSLTRIMGTHLENRQLSVLTNEQQQQKAREIGRIMEAVSRHVPWDCKCLSQALCVKWLLNRYDIPSVMYLGATLDPNDQRGMTAHCWITVGQYTVIGGRGKRDHKVVASFTTPAFS